jgi:hypothetical protein
MDFNALKTRQTALDLIWNSVLGATTTTHGAVRAGTTAALALNVVLEAVDGLERGRGGVAADAGDRGGLGLLTHDDDVVGVGWLVCEC